VCHCLAKAVLFNVSLSYTSLGEKRQARMPVLLTVKLRGCESNRVGAMLDSQPLRMTENENSKVILGQPLTWLLGFRCEGMLSVRRKKEKRKNDKGRQ
jgi:hypothetical protein